MPAQKLKKNSNNRPLLKKLRHWSPVLLFSLVANAVLLQLFVWLISSTEPKAPQETTINILLALGTSQEQKTPPSPAKPLKKPLEHKALAKKNAPETVKSQPKKVVHRAEKTEPKPKPKPQPQPYQPPEHSPKEVTEQPAQPQRTANVNIVNKQKQQPPDINPESPQTPKATAAIKAVPLFRLTRMPKIVDYNLETLKRFYPKDERDFGKEATVEAMILVDKHGTIVDVQIVKSAGASFDAAAKKALLSQALTIQPGYLGDNPVASRVSIPITFSLTD